MRTEYGKFLYFEDMKKYRFLCACLYLSLFGFACNEEKPETSEDNPAVCSYTEPKCSVDGTQLLSCFHGVEQSFDCTGGCINGICHNAGEDTEGCSYTGSRCSNDGLSVISCVNGEEKTIPCANGCENGTCKVVDDPGSDDPVNDPCANTIPSCSEDGHSLITCVDGEEKTTPCDYGCVNHACKTLGSCDYTESECSSNGKYLISCVDGIETAESCEHGCDAWGHTCYDIVSGENELGTSCRLEADPYCKGDALVYCGETAQGNVWVKQDAPENFICGNYEGMNMLLEKCEKAGEEATLCSSSMQLARVCTDVDGQLLYLPDYFSDDTTYCYAGCNGNACAEELPPETCDASTFTESCTSVTGLHQCINSMVYERNCEGGKVCIIDSNQEAVCGEVCTPDTAPAYECFDGYSDEGNPIQIAVPLTCTKNPVSESYGLERAALDQWIDCSGKCSTTKGCE